MDRKMDKHERSFLSLIQRRSEMPAHTVSPQACLQHAFATLQGWLTEHEGDLFTVTLRYVDRDRDGHWAHDNDIKYLELHLTNIGIIRIVMTKDNTILFDNDLFLSVQYANGWDACIPRGATVVSLTKERFYQALTDHIANHALVIPDGVEAISSEDAE